jgi:DNA helicase-2/ATP-dependent DNA helicase PcrA
MEEERRLFYVACSRAKEELYITFPRNVASYDAFFHLPSRFLVEIDKDKYVLKE